jgi:hypothetical protein
VDAVDFGSLYERHSGDVLRFALYLTGERAEAEDVTSETFARAWTVREEIRVGTVKAYLFMIARNLVRDERRRARPSVLEEHEPDRAALLMRAQGELSYEAIAASPRPVGRGGAARALGEMSRLPRRSPEAAT